MPQPAPPNKTTPPVSAPMPGGGRVSWVPVLALLIVFMLGALVLWDRGWTRGRAACDQYEYHLPAIQKFAAELPRPDLSNYSSATTPGYHLALAAIERLTGAGPIALQVVGAIFTIGLLVVFGRGLARAGGRQGLGAIHLTALALPVVCSPYVFTSGVWLLPDNAGWLLVLAVLLPALHRPMTGRTLAWCAVVLALAVFVRQSHLWVAAPMCMAAWMSTTPEFDDSLFGALNKPASRLGHAAFALLACLPALAILGAFAVLWRGLTTPAFQTQHGTGINWATPAFILSLIAVFSPFFIGWLWPAIARLRRDARATLILAAAVGFVVSILPATTFLREPRSSGLWNVVGWLDQHGLVIAGRTSPLIVVLATLGGPLLAAWLAMVNDKRRWIIAAAVIAFIAAQSANANCWQRYHEPFLLMLFALIAAGYAPAPTGENQRSSLLPALRILGPLVLAALLAGLAALSVLTGRDPIHP